MSVTQRDCRQQTMRKYQAEHESPLDATFISTDTSCAHDLWMSTDFLWTFCTLCQKVQRGAKLQEKR